MADAHCEVTYEQEQDCCAPDLSLPIEEPPPPEEPPPTPLGNKFAFAFTFGDALNPIVLNVRISMPSPYAGTLKRWKARIPADIAATLGFQVYRSSGLTGALTAIAGTQPQITANKGAGAEITDWDITTIAAGDSLEVEVNSGIANGVTLVLELETL